MTHYNFDLFDLNVVIYNTYRYSDFLQNYSFDLESPSILKNAAECHSRLEFCKLKKHMGEAMNFVDGSFNNYINKKR